MAQNHDCHGRAPGASYVRQTAPDPRKRPPFGSPVCFLEKNASGSLPFDTNLNTVTVRPLHARMLRPLKNEVKDTDPLLTLEALLGYSEHSQIH